MSKYDSDLHKKKFANGLTSNNVFYSIVMRETANNINNSSSEKNKKSQERQQIWHYKLTQYSKKGKSK